MPFPGFNDLGAFTPEQRRQLEQFESYLQGWLQVEHTDGGGHTFGVWTRVTYAIGNFTASAGTWTVDLADQFEYAYMLVGKTMVLRYSIATTDVSNAGVTLKMAIPGGFVSAARVQRGIGVAADAGGARVAALVEVTASARVIDLYATLAGGGFAITAADNTAVFGTILFEVQ
jgi:hypothetical protein